MPSTPSPPPAPDPVKTAEAQTKSNKETAITQTGLNATDQVTPYGNLNYSQGTPWADGTPHFTATTTLSPAEQNLFNLSTQTQSNLGNIGVEQSDKVRGILNTPFNLNNSINNQQADISRSLLDPVWNQRESQLETKLRNQGLNVGDEAWTNAQRDFGMQRDNAYNSALLADRGQAAQEALTQRNQPLNEISALLSSSQVQQPNFTNTPNTAVAPTDVAGITRDAYNSQLQAYNAQQANSNAFMGGLFGLGGAALGGWGRSGFAFSDRRLKTDIRRVGSTDGGLPVYTYRFKGSPVTEMGVMADEVKAVKPEAVERFGGFDAVDYARI